MPDPVTADPDYIYAGRLAGELYNELSARGVTASRIVYRGGGWTMRLLRRGGLLRGQPEIVCTVRSGPPMLSLLVRRLWGVRTLETGPLSPNADPAALANRLLEIFYARPHRR